MAAARRKERKSMMPEILSMRDLTVGRNGRKKIIHIPSFSVCRGELIALVGPNGAGKSTLLQTINLLLPYQGDMRLFGEEIQGSRQQLLRRRSAMLFQETLLVSGSVFDNVAWPLRFRGMASNEIKDRVHRAFGRFRLRSPCRASGETTVGRRGATRLHSQSLDHRA